MAGATVSSSLVEALSEYREPIQEIIEIGKRLHERNLLASADGNISCRVRSSKGHDEILITPSGLHKGYLKPEDFCILNLEGEVLHGRPSSERAMHLKVFQSAPEAKAVVHAHPPHAIAWTVARPELSELPSECLSEVILAVGSIPFVPYARPGTSQMGEVLEDYLPQHRVMVLRRHGALCWGESLSEAYAGMERLEHSATILKFAQELGGLTVLPKEEVEYLRKVRKTLEPKTL